MKSYLKLLQFLKGFLLLTKTHIFFGWLKKPCLLASNTLKLSKWVAEQKGNSLREDENSLFNDFFSLKRDYSKRYQLYKHVIDICDLQDERIDYLEFGVSGGYSFKWWTENIANKDSRFYGFDTFEGLPEDWGVFKKSDMAAAVPTYDDVRVHFLKGLFQDTLPEFLKQKDFNENTRKVIHMDADLFTSTLFTLTSMASYLKKGDVIFFDEFNVPNHEFYAFDIFSTSFRIKTKLLGAVNNFYQVAFIVE